MMMLYRLVRLIETHAQALAACLLTRVQESEATPDYKHVPAEELKGRVFEIYRHLGEWLISEDKRTVEARYLEIGARRALQGVPLSQLVWAIILTKENLWEYIKKESVLERPVEVFGELEMLQLLDQFFDRAIHYAAIGYERAVAEHGITIAGVAAKNN
ncbi:MAG TPA: hypothetical protein VEI52_24520 [Terriglobales bacterium]|nr:hypothetical protein [Terriglobales bacterium]